MKKVDTVGKLKDIYHSVIIPMDKVDTPDTIITEYSFSENFRIALSILNDNVRIILDTPTDNVELTITDFPNISLFYSVNLATGFEALVSGILKLIESKMSLTAKYSRVLYTALFEGFESLELFSKLPDIENSSAEAMDESLIVYRPPSTDFKTILGPIFNGDVVLDFHNDDTPCLLFSEISILCSDLPLVPLHVLNSFTNFDRYMAMITVDICTNDRKHNLAIVASTVKSRMLDLFQKDDYHMVTTTHITYIHIIISVYCRCKYVTAKLNMKKFGIEL